MDRQRQAAMATSAVPVPPPVPFGRIRRIPAAAAGPNRFGLRISRRHLSPFGDCTFRRGLIPLAHYRIHFGGNAEVAVPECSRLSRAGLEFRGRTGRRSRALARAAAGVGTAGGNCGFFHYNWAGAVEGVGPNELLVMVWKIFYGRRNRRIKTVPWLAVVIGTVTLIGILVPRFSVGRVFVAAFVAIIFGLLVDDGKLQLISDRFGSVDARAIEQLHTFSEAILEVAHDSRKFLASWFSSIIPPLAGKCKGDNAGDVSLGGCRLKSEAGGVSTSPSNKNSRIRFSVLDRKADVETIVTVISQSISRFVIMGTITELTAASIDLLSRMKSGIQDLCLELQTLEAALLARQSELHSEVNQSEVEALHSRPTACLFLNNVVGSKEVEELMHSKVVGCGQSDDAKEEIVPNLDDSKYDSRKQRTSHLPLRMKLKEASRAPCFHESSTLLSAQLEGIEETPKVFPSTSRTWSISAFGSDGTKSEETHPAEVAKSVLRTGSAIESFVGIEQSSSKGDDSDLVDFHKFSQGTDSLIENQSPFSKHFSRSKLTQVMEPQTIRGRSPDPWQSDCTTRCNEQDALARGHWAAKSILRWRNDDESPSPDISLIVDKNSKIERAREDGVWNGRVNIYGSVDFWGKNEGSITKANEPRGTLTKSRATGRGSNFESVDDLEDGQPQEQGSRSSKKEQRQLFRRDLSIRRAGQQRDGKHQPVPFGTEVGRDGKQKWRDADPALAADNYGRSGADRGGPQTVRVDGSSEVTKNDSVLTMGRLAEEGISEPRRMTSTGGSLLYPASARGRVSLHQKIVSTTIPSNGPSKAQDGEGRSTQSMDDAADVNEGNCTGSKRVWDMPPNSEGILHRGPEAGARNGRVTPNSSLACTPSQRDVTEFNVELERSKEARTRKFEKCLDEAGALLEQGTHGLEGGVEVGVAERMLYEAANLLEKASEIYPADLIAVGQWGNTLLVHGQLKLKLSQQLRSMLPSLKASSPLMKREGAIAGREQESMELTLQEVCEECEELLVDAGRKFRRAMSLDKSDFRALYNWGLALCYRGQLISEVGGERAMQDADKVYLAAIDKFEAMLGIDQDYVAGALLNWGLAMQDRSRLRDMGDKERVQLLLQAKELFHDAVHLDPNNGEARGALAVCSAELKELQGFEARQRQDAMKKLNRNWWQRGG